jgi:hypothetical protein
MARYSSCVYQTGQLVPFNGTYEVVGANLATVSHKPEHPIRILHINEVFPTYEGWEVCWHIRRGENRLLSGNAAPNQSNDKRRYQQSG